MILSICARTTSISQVVFGSGFIEPEQGVVLGEIITVQAKALQADTNSIFETSIEQALAAPDGTPFMPEELKSADAANHLLGDMDHSGDIMSGDAVETLLRHREDYPQAQR